MEGHVDAGERLEPREVAGVERDAEIGEGAEVRRVVGVEGGEHSRGGGGGFGEREAPIEDGDAASTMVKLKGE
jgi:hypothetical protein